MSYAMMQTLEHCYVKLGSSQLCTEGVNRFNSPRALFVPVWLISSDLGRLSRAKP